MVKKGLRVEFTVDAFPDEVFQGKISEVRLQPVEVSNVITYTVIVSAQNPDLMLKPGMTAGITVFINEVNDILVVPGKAIRFKPEREMMKQYMESIPEGERPHRPNLNNMTNDRPPQRMHVNEMPANTKRMWVKNGEMIRPVMVKTGLADGVFVEVISGLKEGDEVVTSMKLGLKSEVAEKEVAKKSPFLEQRGGGKGRGSR